MRMGFVGGAYTAKSTAVADEECINFYQETVESQGAIVPTKAYGGSSAGSVKALFGTPGISVWALLPQSPTRGQIWAGTRYFAVGGAQLYEVSSTQVITARGAVANDGLPASLAFNGIQLLIVSGGHAYCFTLATNTLLEVTNLLAGTPAKVKYCDTYFIVMFQQSNKYQMSQVLDGTTWPGTLVNEVSVFPENISAIDVNHRELWVYGFRHAQAYQNTGSLEVFDVIPGTFVEQGSASTFVTALLDNSIFWIDENDRGARSAWRTQGYTPQRISTHAVETDLATYTPLQVGAMTSYSYQEAGHLFWVLYVPGSQWSWVYDVGEGLWHKRAQFSNGLYKAHWGWNHAYAFGFHLIGDWNSGNIYSLSLANLDDNGNPIRSLRRTPTVSNEMEWIYFSPLVIDFQTGVGPQPPLKDGKGNPRPAQAMVRWSDDRGQTWSNEHEISLGLAGQTKTRAILRRLGRSRYRVWEVSITDKVQRAIVDAYMKASLSQ